MAVANRVFQLDEGSSWSRGLGNLLRAEMSRWFGTRRWWTQILIWAAIVNLAVLGAAGSSERPPAIALAVIFSIMLGVAAPVGACILMQGAVVAEKQSGTAAWVLSKPVSRKAFLVAKWVANTAGMSLTMLLAQGLIARAIMRATTGAVTPLLPMLAGLGVHLVSLTFYTTLTLMLGALCNHWGPVIGIPLAFMFGQQQVIQMWPAVVNYLPWTLTIPMDGSDTGSLALAVMLGERPLTYMPLAVTLLASACFLVAAMWIFERQEL